MKTLAGQMIARRLLEANLKHEKPFHAFLFEGPEGIGKLEAAVQFACVLNGAAQMDDDCSNKECTSIRENRNADVRIIRGEGASLKIEQMREMIRDIQIGPHRGKWKIFIIHEAEKMSQAAANSLLKVLEEPPPKGIMIMTTAYPAQILATIRSRCQVIPFRPLQADAIMDELHCRFGIENELAHLITGLAEGMPAKAIALAENPVLLDYRNEVFAEIEQLKKGTKKDMIALVREYERSKNAEEKLRLWNTVIRDILVWRLTKDTSLLYHRDKSEFYDAMKELDIFEAVVLLQNIERAQAKLQKNFNTGLVIRSALDGFNQVFVKEGANG